jgi:hypothetical protein
MTIALFGISSIYNGFQKFMNAAVHFENEPAKLTMADATVQASSFNSQQRALRVLRIAEHGEPTACAGRMVISGRMSDVCAELDRLVELEARSKPSLPH